MKYWLWIIPIDYEPARDLWDFCLREGVAAMQYEIGQKNAELNRDLARQIAAGDKVVAYLNQRRVGGVGTVTKPFFEDPTGYQSDYGNAYGQRVGVKWLAAIGGPIDVRKLPIAMKSLESLVLQSKTIHLIDQASFEQIAEAVQSTHENPIQAELANLIESAQMKSAIRLYKSQPEASAKDRLIKQYAYEQIRRLIAPEVLPNLTVDDFDEHILQIGGVVYEGKKYKSWKFWQNYSVDELKAMLEHGTVQVVGNCHWGFGAATIRAFFAKSGLDDEAIAEQLHDALRVLQDDAKPIKERLEKAQSVNGLWPNLTTGTLMALAPDEWIVLNDKSKQALELLGLTGQFKFTTDNYLDYNEFAKQVQDRYGLEDLTEVDGVFSRYVDAGGNGPPPSPIVSLNVYVTEHGFHFSPDLLATYYLSLQTKPFAILTGVSGTGKTKLAQLFAKWMSPVLETEITVAESPEPTDTSFYIEIKPYMLKYSRAVVPVGFWQYFDVPELGQSIRVRLVYPEGEELCKLGLQPHPQNPNGYLQLLFKGGLRQWMRDNLVVGDLLKIESIDEEEAYRLEKYRPQTRTVIERERNYAFVPVRPDWTDSRGLLGFHNLITGTYSATDFLRLLLRATINLQSDRPRPYFVILDEMNLAKVEYYFADFLSAMESRQLDEGNSIIEQECLILHNQPRCVLAAGNEGIVDPSYYHEERFTCLVRCERCPFASLVDEGYHQDGEFDYEEAGAAGFAPRHFVPPRLTAPLNVYFAGTVNVDETTYMFSPKVLDRANTIEFGDVRLDTYFSVSSVGGPGASTASEETIAAFTNNWQFALLPKQVPELRSDLELAPYRGQLVRLNQLLEPFEMHFGYRVADEVLLYLWNSWKLDDPTFGLDIAFDHQICQKVLPKFHGSQAKLQEPLEALHAFCEEHGYARSAAKIQRMLDMLLKEGFASFA
jgi:5-methylcytosine-specific restriction endonuclease McrBC GTP-binding regulatory subunit McrB